MQMSKAFAFSVQYAVCESFGGYGRLPVVLLAGASDAFVRTVLVFVATRSVGLLMALTVQRSGRIPRFACTRYYCALSVHLTASSMHSRLLILPVRFMLHLCISIVPPTRDSRP